MKYQKRFFIVSIFIGITLIATAKGLDSSDFQLGTPPRIIRTCCAFGDDVGLVAIPFVKVSDIIAKETIGDRYER
jgi:hypothetical protein